MTPKISKREVEGMFHTMLSTIGEDFEINRDDNSFITTGAMNRDKNTSRQYIAFPPETDIKEGDTLLVVIGKKDLKLLKELKMDTSLAEESLNQV